MDNSISNNNYLNEDQINKENINNIYPIIKEFNFSLDEDIYKIKLELNKDSLVIKGTKNDMNQNIFYKNEYNFKEIFKHFENCKNIDDKFKLISDYLMDSSNIKLKLDNNYLIILNKDENIMFKLEKYLPEENDVINDIFSKIFLLEEQINNFSNYGHKLTNTLNEYESKLEKIKNN